MPHRETGPAPSTEEVLDALTRRALEAAERGDWEEARRCYRHREPVLRSHELSAALARRLLAMDMVVHERARLAQAAVARLLENLTATRHALAQFADSCDGGVVTGGSIDRLV